MTFALSLLWTNVLLNFPTPFLLPLAPWNWHHFSSHHSSPLESPTLLNLLCTNSHWLSSENQLHVDNDRFLYFANKQKET